MYSTDLTELENVCFHKSGQLNALEHFYCSTTGQFIRIEADYTPSPKSLNIDQVNINGVKQLYVIPDA